MNYKGPCDLNQSSLISVSSGLRITLETIVFDGGLLNYGAKFIVRGGAYETMEGNARERNVVVEYKDHTTALACYRSPVASEAPA